MRVRDLYTPRVQTAFREEPLSEAARRMCDQNIGALVVVDRHAAVQKPVGMLTDRDIVTGQMQRSADLYCLSVADVMTGNPLVVSQNTEVTEAISSMQTRSVRRAPVVDSAGKLVGIITLDDLLPGIARELSSLATLLAAQVQREQGRGSD